MKLTVYRQSSKQRPDGTIVYKGEDARPFVNDKVFFVADGLGGAAAIRHQHINSDLFEKDKLMAALFEGVYEEFDDETFVKYVTDSFFELFAVKDCYTDNINNIKKSGYFASRIVTAILLHEIIYNENLNPQRLFEIYDSLDAQEKKNDFLSQLGNFFAIRIQEDMRKIAQKANLYYESSYSGLALLGSTLCATIYLESSNTVRALYLTAGDSRPYVWTRTEGLCQVIEDQEGPDGGMTNYIKANEGETFEVRCNYFSFNKPCVLFNASDGCFDSGYFLSQMAFEKLLLEKAVSSEDVTSMSESIYESFLTYGRHDDSSTIAMKLFGYKSFSSFQESAISRLNQLQEEFFSKLPDLLDIDYITEYKESSVKLPLHFSSIKPKFEEDTFVKDFCGERMKNDRYPPFESRILEIERRTDEARQQIINSTKSIEELVARNYIRFMPFSAHRESWGEKRTVSRIQSIDQKHQLESENYIRLIEEYRLGLDETTKRLKSTIEEVIKIGVPYDYSDYDEISTALVEECDRSMGSLFDFFYSIKNKRQGAIRQMAQLRKDYISQNLKLASGNTDTINEICKQLISGEIDIEVVQNNILPDDYEELRKDLIRIKDANTFISLLSKEESQKAFQECLDAYWEENYVSIIAAIVSDYSIPISNELRDEGKTIVDDLKSQEDALRTKAELQSRLFQLYDVSYRRYLGGVHE